MDIDLSGAVLFDFDFRHCTARSAMFRACRFFGVARFLHAEFVREAQFDGAEFFGAAWFEAAKFGNDAWFGGARFSTVADFRRATFERRTAFGRNSWLGPAEFSGRVNFSETTFDRPPELSGVRAAEAAAASGIQQWPVGWSTVADAEDAQWLVVEAGDAS
jgi:uncharacterized protein YjbI with pentapeptide repeats